MNIADFRGDENLEEKGTWLPMEDAEFLIAAHLNRDHRRALDRWRTKLSGGLRKQDPKATEELTIQAAAAGLLRGWRGKVEEEGTPMEFTPENAVKLLRIRFFRDWVLEQSVNVSNFARQGEADDTAALKSGPGVGDGMESAPGAP